MSDQEYEFRAEYIELSDAVEQYAADMLGQARDSEEVRRESIAPLIYFTSYPFAFFKTAASAYSCDIYIINTCTPPCVFQLLAPFYIVECSQFWSGITVSRTANKG